jgi:uncharacterized membrane protein
MSCDEEVARILGGARFDIRKAAFINILRPAISEVISATGFLILPVPMPRFDIRKAAFINILRPAISEVISATGFLILPVPIACLGSMNELEVEDLYQFQPRRADGPRVKDTRP